MELLEKKNRVVWETRELMLEFTCTREKELCCWGNEGAYVGAVY